MPHIESGRRPPEHERPSDEERSEQGPERESAPEEIDVRAETGRERASAVERIAEAVWERPARYVEHVIAHKLVPQLRKFVERFSSLDDDALATDELRSARAEAEKALDEHDRAA